MRSLDDILIVDCVLVEIYSFGHAKTHKQAALEKERDTIASTPIRQKTENEMSASIQQPSAHTRDLIEKLSEEFWRTGRLREAMPSGFYDVLLESAFPLLSALPN